MPDTKIIQSAPKVAPTEVDTFSPDRKDMPANEMERLAKEILVYPLLSEHDALQCQSWSDLACQIDFVRKGQATLLWETAGNRNDWLWRNIGRFDDSPSDGLYSEEEVSRLIDACKKENPLEILQKYRSQLSYLR